MEREIAITKMLIDEIKENYFNSGLCNELRKLELHKKITESEVQHYYILLKMMYPEKPLWYSNIHPWNPKDKAVRLEFLRDILKKLKQNQTV